MHLENLIAKGNTASIYQVNNKVIKVFNDYLPGTTALYEANKQKIAYLSGLSVPQIFDVINIDKKQAIVMEHIIGDTLGEIMFKEPENTIRYIQLSIDIQLKIHDIEVEELEVMNDKLIGQIKNAKLLNNIQKEYLINRINNMKFDKKLCHGDFHVFNIIMQNETPFVIDWVDSSSGDIRADVCRSYLLYSIVSVELSNLYLDLYCKNSGLKKHEILEWAPIIAGARLSENISANEAQRLLSIVEEGCIK